MLHFGAEYKRAAGASEPNWRRHLMEPLTHGPDKYKENSGGINPWLVQSKQTGSTPIIPLPATRPPRVLVVDDNHDCADGMAILLRLWGYDARVAYTAWKAIRVTAKWLPDVALLDLAMPKVDGFELAAFLQAIPGAERLVLIAVTGLTEKQYRERAREVGIQHYFLKPCNLAALRAVIDRAARRTAARSYRRPKPG
jgi:CheY-like chemotaxis protein